MKNLTVFCILYSVFSFPASAAVSGTILNGTSGAPQPGVTVNLVQPGAGGMQQLGSTISGENGAFAFDATPAAGGPALIQATYRDVTYTQIMPPGTPTTGVRVNVYEASAEPPAGLSADHLMLLEPGIERLEISETFMIRNASNVAFHDPVNGTVRLFLPEGAPENLTMQVDSTGVPVQRPLIKTQTPGLYKVDYPVKPGETRFDVSYSVPAAATFSNKVVQTTPPMRLVTPATVTLSGENIQDLGQEQSIGARVYQVNGTSFNVSIEGTGAIRGVTQPSAEDSGAPRCCEEVPAQIHDQLPWILTFGLAILTLGGVLLYRRGTA